MAAFGCNYQGDIAPAQVVRTLEDGLAIAAEAGAEITVLLARRHDGLGDAGAHRARARRGARRAGPRSSSSLHLHDTRGLAVANAHAGLRMGVSRFDSTVGGLGGCPFAGQKGAAGNICTEELVLLCEEMGIDTGVDLDKLIEVGRMAEEIVGHAAAERADPRRQPRCVPPQGCLMSATPLTGLKVLEFSHTVMGPTAGLVLAELGADVVKVEPAPAGRPHARPRRLRRRLLRRLQPQQAQPGARPEAARGPGRHAPAGRRRPTW